jgi:chemotaxis protein methyltransferase WspC
LPLLRVLSVPCSSGEEPYSLAITLLEAQVPTHRFVIHAADVSTHALERAKHAVYGRNSFRGKELSFRDRHFRATKDGYALNAPVRECVQFFRDNLLGGAFLAGHAPYDFILCRNLLIYFDRATQIQALEKLYQLLAAEGVLFVGPAEVPLVTHKGFVNANIPMAFACRKTAIKGEGQSEKAAAEATGSLPVLARVRTPPERVTDSTGARRLAAPGPPGTKPVSTAGPGPFATFTRSSAVRSLPDAPSDLAAARQLADAGRFEEAGMVCQAHLRDRGPSAEAYYILGLVRDATGDPQAIEHYRKALYLEPNHYETLLQMSLLLERTGDAAGARLFKRRAQRVGRRTD